MVEDLDVEGVHVRVFRPPGEAPKPGVIYCHGGGWVLGSVAKPMTTCAPRWRRVPIAWWCWSTTGWRPSIRIPAQLKDSLKVLTWMREHGRALGIDPTRIIGAGDSAGGQMTAGLGAAPARSRRATAERQVMIYPVLGADTETPSYVRNAEAPCLTRDRDDFLSRKFSGTRGNGNWTDPYARAQLRRRSFDRPATRLHHGRRCTIRCATMVS